MSYPHAIGHRIGVFAAVFGLVLGASVWAEPMKGPASNPPQSGPGQPISADIAKVLASPTDVLGEAALKLPDGPTYEYFVPLLAPMRYVDAPFRHYPITLSAPGAPVKARLVSNGSQINALARQANWVGEAGTPVTFRVTRDIAVFGENLANLDGPKYAQGYLPIVMNRYRYGTQTFAQEVFASVDPELSKHGVVFVRMTAEQVPDGKKGKVEAQIESAVLLKAAEGVVRDADGKVLVAYEPKRWHWTPARAALIAELAPGESAVLAIYTEPAAAPLPVNASVYDAQRKRCAETWDKLLASGANVVTPEKVVNDAWRATVIGNYMLLSNDQMRYSQGNQYAKLYIGEGGDAVRTMALQGYTDTARKCITPLFVYTRKGLEFHQAALKLQMLAHYYWLTRDADFVKSIRVISQEGRKPGWQTELDLLLTGREEKSGLFPPEKYAGDIDDKVYSLNSNANGWRGLRDMSLVLAEIGETALAERCANSAKQFRAAVMAALDKSVDRSVAPPFVPLALFGAEPPYESIVQERIGSYWNIMTKYVLTSGVFPIDHDYADYLIAYAQQRGGLCMGMNRNSAASDTWWIEPRGINDLYGMRYALALLERDEPDRALVSFYGKLAHGFTRDTFIDGEGASIVPQYADEAGGGGGGRQTYLPPNSAGNACFQQQLRYLLVQDYDREGDDGRADTLRLMFATPRAWLADGKKIAVERAPTMFGDVSFNVVSELAAGRVSADVKLPERNAPAKTFLRLRLPGGAKIASAEAGGKPLKIDGETIDLSGLSGNVSVGATVGK